jgi:hypothetical protein
MNNTARLGLKLPIGLNPYSTSWLMRTMGKPSPVTVVLLSLFFAGALSQAACQTLAVEDSENPETLVNTEPKTSLRLKIIAPNQPLVAGTNCDIRVELHNTGYRVEVIYMPALTMWPAFRPSKNTLGVTDEFGPPMLFGRQAAKDEGLNYVVLMGGDYYGRTYYWAPPASGEVTFHAVYSNTNAGPTRQLPAWRGKLQADSAALTSIRK